MLDYAEYERLFNEGDDVAHTERFFTDDVVFAGGSIEVTGKPGLYKFLAFAHNGILERMRPQLVMQQRNETFVEVDMDFHATKPRADFPFGAMLPGDMVTVKFFVTYKHSDGKVHELKAMTWAPNRGVTRIPRLGQHPSQKAAFLSYLAAFSNADTERFSAFYNEDVTLALPSAPVLVGKQAIVNFYAKMFPTVREQLSVVEFSATDDALKLVANARFTAVDDAPEFVVSPLKQGEALEMPVEVRYQLQGGLISKISVERLGEVKKVSQ
ncbi:nuclear transport factor 2 family protein [Pandoraea pnomenusa]|uniref:nuclear transport factor 2 family protein n=1 Tax=Pandoraea pnomenusa TaxID=93220 RepID=UPI0033422582